MKSTDEEKPVRGRFMTVNNEPSKTKVSEAKRCDINTILERHRKTGMVEHVNRRQGFYGDVSGVSDYLTALNRVKIANEAFNSLSARIRDRFKNDPAELLAFLGDESNREEAIALGIIEKPEEVDKKTGEIKEKEAEKPK